MTDKEMAEEYCNNEVPFDTTESGEKLYTENDLKYSFLAGHKAGRPEWHKVADGDLPKGENVVLIYWKAGDMEYVSVVEPYKVTEDKHIIAWCELPTYTEE